MDSRSKMTPNEHKSHQVIKKAQNFRKSYDVLKRLMNHKMNSETYKIIKLIQENEVPKQKRTRNI